TPGGATPVSPRPLLGRSTRARGAERYFSRSPPSSQDSCQRSADKFPRFFLNLAQVLDSAKALRVQLVDIFGAGRTRREPPGRGEDLQPADGGAVAGAARWRCSPAPPAPGPAPHTARTGRDRCVP